MKVSFKDQVLPHLVAIAVFYILILIPFSPQVVGGKKINQHDILMHRGGAQELVEYREATGREGLWANSMFSGMPAYMVNLVWSRKALDLTHKAAGGFLPHPVSVIFVALLSAYLMLLCFGVRPYLALVGAIGFGLSSYLIIGISAGHNSRIAAIAYAPMVVGALHLVFKKTTWFSLFFLALAMALHLRFNHLQITYYLILFLAPYGIIWAVNTLIKSNVGTFLKGTGAVLVASLLAFLTYLGPFLTTLEYSKYSIRGKSELSQVENDNYSQEGLSRDYAFQYNYGPGEFMTLLIPNYVGGSSTYTLYSDEDSKTRQIVQGYNRSNPQAAQQIANMGRGYWGVQQFSSPYYAGAILVLLFMVGLFFVDPKYSLWLLGIALLGVLLSMGKNFSAFNYWMFDHFPGYNKFRSVTFAIFLPVLSISLLSGLALEKLAHTGLDKAKLRKFLMVSGVLSVALLLLAVVGGLGNFLSPNEAQLPPAVKNAFAADRLSLFRNDIWRALLFIGLAIGTLYLVAKRTLNPVVAGLILTALVAIDMSTVNQRVFGEDNFQRSLIRTYFSATNADQQIINKTQPGDRVINPVNPWADSKISYYHASVGGYHGAKMRRYQDLIDRYLTDEVQVMISNLQSGRNAGNQTPVLNMLNTRFALVPQGTQAQYFENTANFGPAWFAQEVIAVNSPDEEIAALGSENLSTTAIIDQSKFPNVPSGGSGSVQVVDYVPGDVTYQVNATEGGLVVFSEIYYPVGWEVTIDGQPADLYRANYVLRAVDVPQGQHTVRMVFNPPNYRIGNSVMNIASVVLVFGFLIMVGLTLRRAENQEE